MDSDGLLWIFERFERHKVEKAEHLVLQQRTEEETQGQPGARQHIAGHSLTKPSWTAGLSQA